MNPSTGEIREFPEKGPWPDRTGAERGPRQINGQTWVPLEVGEEVSFKGLHFRIHRINPAAGQIILVGIKGPSNG